MRGALALDLVRDSALVLSNLDDTHRHRSGSVAASPARSPGPQGAGEEQLPVIRLHELRHTHATLLLADGVLVKVASERLGPPTR
jgi:integrase